MAGVVRFSLRERWEAKVSPEPNSGCWLWLGAVDGHGYGQLAMPGGKKRLATHAALELHGRPRRADAPCALHKCDNPNCVNPDHLEWGTMKQNTHQMMARGRSDFSGFAIGHEIMRQRWPGRPTKTCDHCGLSYRMKRHQVRNRNFFCSSVCSIAWQKANYTGQTIRSWSAA